MLRARRRMAGAQNRDVGEGLMSKEEEKIADDDVKDLMEDLIWDWRFDEVPDAMRLQCSIAISLKRIADALEGAEKRTGMRVALADIADSLKVLERCESGGMLDVRVCEG